MEQKVQETGEKQALRKGAFQGLSSVFLKGEIHKACSIFQLTTRATMLIFISHITHLFHVDHGNYLCRGTFCIGYHNQSQPYI